MGKNITPELLRKLLRYDPDTGKLYWLPRTADFFSARSTHSIEHSCCAWNAKNAGKEAFTALSNGYRTGAIFRRNFGAQRIVWAIVHGEWPDQIDHINGVRSDNRLCNLRSVSGAENQRNMKRPANNQSGHIGVTWDKQRSRWRAEIGGDTKFIGRFRSLGEAVAARKSAENERGYHPNHGRAV